MSDILERGTTFIWENARLLDRAIFELHFREGAPEQVIQALRSYQNEDGGFGHALEADLRAPDSQPLFVEFALQVLCENNLRDAEMTSKACDFLSLHSDLKQGIATLLPSAEHYPRAQHWHNPEAMKPSLDRLTSLASLAVWQGANHPWLQGAVEASLKHITQDTIKDAHILLNAFHLAESLPPGKEAEQLKSILVDRLLKADFFILEAPAKGYGLTPLAFAPSPTSYCREIFTDAQIKAHLDDLMSQQQEDGGWAISWQPPEGAARAEWRAYKTVTALVTLRAYGRI